MTIPYQVRKLPFDELDRIKRELQGDLILYPAGTAVRQRLRAHIAAIDAGHASRAGNGNGGVKAI